MFVPLVDTVLSLALALVVAVVAGVVVALSFLVMVVMSFTFSLLTLALGTTCCVVSFFSTIVTCGGLGTFSCDMLGRSTVEATLAFSFVLAFALAIERIKVIL